MDEQTPRSKSPKLTKNANEAPEAGAVRKPGHPSTQTRKPAQFWTPIKSRPSSSELRRKPAANPQAANLDANLNTHQIAGLARANFAANPQAANLDTLQAANLDTLQKLASPKPTQTGTDANLDTHQKQASPKRGSPITAGAVAAGQAVSARNPSSYARRAIRPPGPTTAPAIAASNPGSARCNTLTPTNPSATASTRSPARRLQPKRPRRWWRKWHARIYLD